MRISLIVFGVIFLVIGGLLFFVPNQEFKADTTTTEDGVTDTQTSTARINVPIAWAFTATIIGFILLALGLIISSSTNMSSSRKESYEEVIELKEETEDGNKNKHKTVKKQTSKN